jgi:transcriptional regulator with XRE-family HTH domain
MKKQSGMPAMPEVGTNVKKERRSLQWSLETLALRSGVSKAMLSQIEAGKTNPTVGTLWKIAQALEVEFDALLVASIGVSINSLPLLEQLFTSSESNKPIQADVPIIALPQYLKLK